MKQEDDSIYKILRRLTRLYCPPNLPYTTYIKRCLSELVTCDFIYYVNDVTTSKGLSLSASLQRRVGLGR